MGFCTAVAALFFSGCGGDDAPVNNAPGPGVYSAFAGVTIDINPTISFLSNGQLTYLNSAANSAFPAAASALNGSYTYTPAADYLSGSLVVTLPGLGQVLNLTFQSFTTQGGKVTGFTTVYNGQSYTSNVTSGTLTPAAVSGSSTNTGSSSGSNSGGSSSGSGSTTVTTPVSSNEALAPDIPSSMQGTYNLTYTNVQTGSPIAEGTQKTFVIGAKTLTFDNKILTGPVHRNQNPYEWIFKDGDIEYEASIRADNNKLNEINVAKTGGTPWYGQYRESSGSSTSTGSTGTTTGGTGLIFSTSASDAPYSNGQSVAFTFTKNADNTKTSLAFNSKTLTNPAINSAVTAPYAAYIFTDGSTKYEVITENDTTIYEINVSVNDVYKGQFAASTSSNSGGSTSGGALTSGLYYHPNANASVTQPYTSNQAVSFTLSSATISGSTLAFSGKTLSNPTAGTPTGTYTVRTFTDSASGLTYEVTVDNNTTIVEIVVSNSSTWIGAFTTVNSSSSSGTGSGGSTSGNGTASFASNGNFVAGTTFTHKVLSYTITPAGAAAISGFPTFTVDESVTFTIGSDGSLNFKGFSLAFKAREGNFNLYQLTTTGASGTDTWLGTVALQPGDAAARVVLSFGRATIALPPSVTTFTYALN